MKRVFGLLALLAALLLSAVPVSADDGFYVIPIRVAEGTKIISLPCTINTSGYYYLTGNLSYTGGHGIIIAADNVTLDLMGFCLTGPNASNAYYGIYITGKNVEVRNGSLSGWYWAVYGTGTPLRAIGLRAEGNTFGIYFASEGLIKGCTASQGSFGSGWGLGVGSGSIIGCTVRNFTPGSAAGNLFIGPGGGTASGNAVLDCTSIGIRAIGPTTISYNTVSNCTTGIDASGGGSIIGNAVYTISSQTGIAPATDTARPALVDQNTSSGAGTHYGPGSSATVWGANAGR